MHVQFVGQYVIFCPKVAITLNSSCRIIFFLFLKSPKVCVCKCVLCIRDCWCMWVCVLVCQRHYVCACVSVCGMHSDFGIDNAMIELSLSKSAK